MTDDDLFSEKSTGHHPERHRSRAHPSHSLPEAIERARKLHEKAGYKWAPVGIVADMWGYSEESSRGKRAVAALKQFGLLEDEGSREARRVKLTPLARRIMDHPDEVERRVAIREAALVPALHRELWETHEGNLPHDDALLKWELTSEGALNEKAAVSFIANLRDTLAFAKLDTGVALADDEGDKEDALNDESPPPSVPPTSPAPLAHSDRPTPGITYKNAEPFDLRLLLPTGEQAILTMPDRQDRATFAHLVRALKLNLQLIEPVVTRGQDSGSAQPDEDQWNEGWPDSKREGV